MIQRLGTAVILGSMILGVWLLRGNGRESAAEPTSPRLGATVRDFGARGDGESDDTAAIQRAVDAKVGSIIFPRGVYRLTKTIVISLDRIGPTSLVGDGTAKIVMAGAGPAFRFVGTHQGTADPKTSKPELWQNERSPMADGLVIEGAHAESDGITATGTMQLTVTRCNIRKVRHAIHLVERNRNVLIANCHLYDNRGCGIFLDHVSLHQTNISACHISYNQQGGVVCKAGDVRNVHISGCDIEGNMNENGPPSANVWFDSSEGSVAEAAIVGCTIQHDSKSPNSANIRIQGKTTLPRRGQPVTFRCGHVTIADNVLSDVSVNVELEGTRGVTITGNTFWQGFAHNLLVKDCSQIVVANNVMERNPLYGYTREANNAVEFRDCQDCSITGLHLHNVQLSPAGLVMENCNRFHVTQCTILDCDNGGILWKEVRQSRLSDCLIRDDRDPQKPSPAFRVIGGGDNEVDRDARS